MLDFVDNKLTTARISVATTWLADGPHSHTSYTILKAVRAMNGVEEAHFSPSDDSILKIEYARKRTGTDALLNQIHQLDIMTRLVDY